MNVELYAQLSPELKEAVDDDVRRRVKEALEFNNETYSYVAKVNYSRGFTHGSMMWGALALLAGLVIGVLW